MKCLAIAFMILAICSCGSMEGNSQRYNKGKQIFGPLSVNAYGKIIISGEHTQSVTMTTPKEFIADINKAVEWDKVENKPDMSKEINSYYLHSMKVTYNYTAKSKKSFISIMYRDPRYSQLVEFDHAVIEDYQKAISELLKSDEKAKQVESEIVAMEKLK